MLWEIKGGTDAIQGLIDLVREGISGDQSEFERAVECIARIGMPARPHIIPLLEDNDVVMRRFAIACLGEIADKGAIPYLLDRALYDSDGDVQQDAAGAFYRFGEAAVQPLIRIMGSAKESAWVAENVLRAIGIPETLTAVEQWKREQGR